LSASIAADKDFLRKMTSTRLQRVAPVNVHYDIPPNNAASLV